MTRHATTNAQQSSATTMPSPSGILQRKCACGTHTIAGGECESCQREKAVVNLQRATINSETVNEVPPIVHEVLRSSGQPLDPATRAFLEPRFGHDFSGLPVHAQASVMSTLKVNQPDDTYEQQAAHTANQVMARTSPFSEPTPAFNHVRIHTGAQAAESARMLIAHAYTVGSHIVFDQGQYAPSTRKGQQLLAHELTHVAQQSGGLGTGLIMRDTPDAGVGPQKNPATPTPASSTETLFFQDPKIAGDVSQPDRRRVYVEANLSSVGNASVRFAYPLSELVASGNVSKPSKKVEDAKQQILKLIAEVIKDIGTYTFSSPQEETRIKKERARLGEAFRGLTPSKPLNIFIATLDSPSEILTGKYIPYTDSVYIDAKDVGDKSKLEAAIRLPLQNLAGGISAKTAQQTPAVSQAELKKTTLHESLHVMLINKGIGSDAQWNKLKSSASFKISGPSDAQAKGEELVRKFLIAQEEVFVYESVGTLYPPVDQVKGDFDVFIKNAERLLKKKGSTLKPVTQSISVSEKVDNKTVAWSITYNQPDSLTLTAGDIQAIDLILMVYPNRL